MEDSYNLNLFVNLRKGINILNGNDYGIRMRNVCEIKSKISKWVEFAAKSDSDVRILNRKIWRLLMRNCMLQCWNGSIS